MSDRIEEHMMVVLTTDLPKHGLRAGDVGCIVMEYGNQKAFEVEFEALASTDCPVLTLERDQVRAKAANEIYHVRTLA